MNKPRTNKLLIVFKVFIAHLFIIFLLDLNISAYIKKDSNNFNKIENAQFLNLKSISLEDLKKKRKLIEDKKRKLEALKKKRKQDAIKKKKKLEAEKKKKELEKLKEDEKEKLADYELQKLENELLEIEKIETLIKQQIIRNAQLSDAEAKYILTIKSKIENNWLIPHDTKHDKICTAIVNQLPSGKVTSVRIHGCKGDSLYIDSLINAVWKSSPLPVAPDIEVFQENIVLQFEGPK